MREYLPKSTKQNYLIAICALLVISQVFFILGHYDLLDIILYETPFALLALLLPFMAISIAIGSNPVANFLVYVQENTFLVELISESLVGASIHFTYALIIGTVAYGARNASKRLLKPGFYILAITSILSVINVLIILIHTPENFVFLASMTFITACVMGVSAYLIHNLEYGEKIPQNVGAGYINETADSGSNIAENQGERETQTGESTQYTESQSLGDSESEAPQPVEDKNESAQNQAAIYTLLNYVGTPQKKLMAAIGAILIAIGALLPWISVSIFDLTRRGIDADGTITFAGSLIVLVLVVFTKWGRKNRLLSLVIGIIVALISLLYIIDPLFGVQIPDEDLARGVINIGSGLYVTLLGSILVVFSTIESVYK